MQKYPLYPLIMRRKKINRTYSDYVVFYIDRRKIKKNFYYFPQLFKNN